MARRRKKNSSDEPRSVTRKEVRRRAKDRRQNRQLVLWAGGAVVVALLLVAYGLINEYLIKPNSVLAKVADQEIITRDFWKRGRLEKSTLENQLNQLQLLAQQFGGQSNTFAAQINQQISQIQATLASPFSLGTQVLNDMIQEKVIQIKAQERGITVSDEEVEQALREEVAASQGAVTVPQATATTEAATAATATAASFTPTPTPTLDASAALTDTAAVTDTTALQSPTPAPQPTQPVLNEERYQEGLAQLETNLEEQAGMSLAEYKNVIRNRLVSDKLQEQVADELVDPTEEQVHVRHILIRVPQATPEATVTGEATAPAETPAIETPSTETPVPETPSAETPQTSGTETPVTTNEAGTEATANATETPSSDTEASDAPLTEAEALALAEELRQRILNGEDFATLAQEYSEDPGSAAQGGDLGWIGRGVLVPEFEDVAFSLPVGEISKPVRTDFGYHLIEVLERDENRPKDPNQLAQERQKAFQDWLQEQTLAMDIQRPDDLSAKLPPSW